MWNVPHSNPSTLIPNQKNGQNRDHKDIRHRTHHRCTTQCDWDEQQYPYQVGTEIVHWSLIIHRHIILENHSIQKQTQRRQPEEI